MVRINTFHFLASLDLAKDVMTRLSLHLHRTSAGREDVLTTPLASALDPLTIRDGWDRIMEGSSEVMNDELRRLEADNRSKFGPRSIAKSWKERTAGVLAYFDKTQVSLDYSLLDVGLALASRLRPLSFDSALKFIKNNTNSGLPLYVRKSKVKETLSENLTKLQARTDPCILFTRTQEQGKTRPVWGFPFIDTLIEMCFYRPLFEFQSKLMWRSALRGPHDVDLTLTRIILSAIRLGEKLVSIDFSRYDTTVQSGLIDKAFDYIEKLFQPQFSSRIREIALRFKTIELITPSGILKGNHGVPSGSTFTNEVDSIVQYLIAKFVGILDDQLDVQGDDGAYRTSDPEKLFSAFKGFGLIVNTDKSYVSDNYLVYCQKLYHIDYLEDGLIGGIYPTYRAINRILYLEKFDKFLEDEITGSDYFSIRCIAILENCKYHPLFEELVTYIYNLDKYNLKFSSKGLHKYIERTYATRGTTDELMNQYGDYIKGFRSFETVKILHRLSH
jgi:hypothetical protein